MGHVISNDADLVKTRENDEAAGPQHAVELKGDRVEVAALEARNLPHAKARSGAGNARRQSAHGRLACRSCLIRVKTG